MFILVTFWQDNVNFISVFVCTLVVCMNVILSICHPTSCRQSVNKHKYFVKHIFNRPLCGGYCLCVSKLQF